MNSIMILAEEANNAATVVNEFEQTLLRIFILIIMFGLGAGLTPKDFWLALRRPWGVDYRMGDAVWNYAADRICLGVGGFIPVLATG